MKEELVCLLEERNACKIKKENLEKKLLEKEKARKEMTPLLAILGRNVLLLHMESGLVIRTNEQLISCPFQKTTNGDLATNKMLRNIRQMYVRFAHNAETSIVKYRNIFVSELVPSMLELSGNWKRGAKKGRNWELAEMLV